MISVFIADNSPELCNQLSDFLIAQPDMHVIGTACDGDTALAQIRSLTPDVVILDIILPCLDGMAVMENISCDGPTKKPQVIIYTALGTDAVMQRFIELGAVYFLIKPCNFGIIADRIRQFTDEAASSFLQETRQSYNLAPTREEETLITQLLHEIGVPPHFKGYNYLRDAALIVAQDAPDFGICTRQIYPKIAEKYGATASGVEAAIRNSVVACWEGGNRDYLSVLTSSAGALRKTFPTNTVVIAKLADAIRTARQLDYDKRHCGG